MTVGGCGSPSGSPWVWASPCSIGGGVGGADPLHDRGSITPGKHRVTSAEAREIGLTAKIAWAHLKEIGDYYTRLEAMEADAERAQALGKTY